MFGISTYGSAYLGGYFGSESSSATLADALSKSVADPVFLCELTAGKHEPIWNHFGGPLYYLYSTEADVEAVYINGVEMPLSNSADVEGWNYSKSNRVLSLIVFTDPNLSNQFVQVIYKWYVADTAIEKNGFYWDGYISSLPSLSLRLEETFGGKAQLGGGSLTLRNESGYWDTKAKYDWQAGTAVLRMGTVELPYESFVTIGSWDCDSVQKDNETFKISLLEKKSRLKKKIPFEVYTRDEFPNISTDSEGASKQLAYGIIKGAEPLCIDVTTRTFKLADHAIKAIDSISVLNGEAWISVSPETSDLATATFTLSASDWNTEDNQSVSVSFQGKTKSNGYLMNNASDQLADLLGIAGITDLDTASFVESERLLEAGYIWPDRNNKACFRSPSFYINESIPALDIIETICEVTNGYFFVDASGFYQFKVFQPKPEDGLVEITEKEILEGSFDFESKGKLKTSKAVVHYAENFQEEYSSVIEAERDEAQWTRRQEQPVLDDRTAPLNDRDHARRFAQQLVFEGYRSPFTFTVSVKWGAWLLTAGDFVHLVYPRHSLNQVYEVRAVEYNLTNRVVKLTLSNMHGLTGRQGFWCANDEELDWSYSGSLTQAQKQQNAGHWHNENDLVNSSSPTEEDYQISVWS